jgi:hypothetical protein
MSGSVTYLARGLALALGPYHLHRLAGVTMAVGSRGVRANLGAVMSAVASEPQRPAVQYM